jgi:hypothetical protein
MEADPFNPDELRAATRKLRAVVENSGWSDLDIRSLATGICVTAKRMRLAAGAAHRPTRDRGRRGGDGR